MFRTGQNVLGVFTSTSSMTRMMTGIETKAFDKS